MSYAEAAASSGPTGATKIPKPAELEVTTEPLGSIETVDPVTFEKERKKAQEVAGKTAYEVELEAKKAAKALRDEASKIEKEWESFKKNSTVESVVDYVKQLLATVGSYFNKTFSTETVATVSTELKNPAVVGQIAVIGAGAAAGWFVFSESDRIRSDNKYVVALHAGIITAVVLADVYAFQYLYPKGKK